VRLAAATLLMVCAVTACGTAAPVGRSRTSPSSGTSASAAPSAEPTEAASPAGSPISTQLSCSKPVTATHALALLAYTDTTVLGILDVSSPFKPTLLCWLSPAQGGRFDQSSSRVIFWAGDKLGSADLATGKVVETDQLPATPSKGAFSADGKLFAYRVGDDNVGVSTHVHGIGYDRTLYTEEPIGGHGGPPYGPLDQLEFSADGTQLLDYYDFRPTSGPPKLLVFRTADWASVFQSASAPAGGVWSRSGNTPYFFVWGPQPPTGELDTLDTNGGPHTVAGSLNGFYWPRMQQDGGGIVYDTYDTAGQPHIWRLELATHAASQLSTATGSLPVFVSPTIVWFNEEKPCDCGPGGLSAPDGVILAYNFAVGGWTSVDMSQTAPGVGAPQPTTREVVDVLF